MNEGGNVALLSNPIVCHIDVGVGIEHEGLQSFECIQELTIVSDLTEHGLRVEWGAIPLTSIEYTRTGPFQPMVDTLPIEHRVVACLN